MEVDAERPSLSTKLQRALMHTTKKLKKRVAPAGLSPALERQCVRTASHNALSRAPLNLEMQGENESPGAPSAPGQGAILAYFAQLLVEQDAEEERHYTFADILAYQVMHNELATLIGEKPEFTVQGNWTDCDASASEHSQTTVNGGPPDCPFQKLDDVVSLDPDAGSGSALEPPSLSEITDMLVSCGSAIVKGERSTAVSLLSQIRSFATPFGSSLQRLAHYFVEGLVAKLSNRGAHLLIHRKEDLSTFNSARAYEYICSKVPYFALAHHFQNCIFLETMEGAERVHIIDYGIANGYQWPSLMQALACRPEGPPELLRITGIEFPQTGGQPDKRVKETGHRLAKFAASFGIPFEYNAIACMWEDVPITSLGLRQDEALAVSSVFRLRHMFEETALRTNPRNVILQKICSMKPKVFFIGVMSWSSNGSFISRIREAIPFYHCYFDIGECLMPRDNMHRLNVETHIFGHDLLNAISCEGFDRRERPEHYRQWHQRILNAGFEQIGISDKTFVRTGEILPRYNYHRDWVLSKDHGWMLLGWKNTIQHGLSAWRPRRV